MSTTIRFYLTFVCILVSLIVTLIGVNHAHIYIRLKLSHIHKIQFNCSVIVESVLILLYSESCYLVVKLSAKLLLTKVEILLNPRKSMSSKRDLGGMGHLSILVWIKVHHNQNTSTILEFPVYTLLDQKHNFYNFWKGQNYERPKGIRTHYFVDS